MKNGFNYYRIKMQWKAEQQDGSIDKVKTEDLVYSTSYSEAEAIAYAIIQDQSRDKHDDIMSFEIIKTKIDDMLFSNALDNDGALVGGMIYNFFPSVENGEGFYSVRTMTTVLDERTAKEKKTYSTIYTPADNYTDAGDRVLKYMKTAGAGDVVIRDVKFDQAQSILWPIDTYQQKVNDLA